jgi:hypothetical protein
MRKYYFYGCTQTPGWYTLTTEVLRDAIGKAQDETGRWVGGFPVIFVFTGKMTEAKDKDEAEDNFRKKVNLVDCKEPACMLRARREFFEQQFLQV